MSTQIQDKPSGQPLTLKDLHIENPRWCAGCGDFGIIAAIKRFMVDQQMVAAQTVNVSGIGCSGRAPNYINAYGAHTIHGRPITVALGLALARPDLHIFIHSGDGDALSIGGNHLIHGINKNFKCVFLLYDNELYALTKSQTSPTTRKGHATNTQPFGTLLEPINPVRTALGLGASFVASTTDWMPDHLASTLGAAFQHSGFAFVHISQRCPHFDAENFDHKSSSWFSFLKHPNGIAPDKRLTDKTECIEHNPSDIEAAFRYSNAERRYYGLFFQDKNKPRYDQILHDLVEKAEKKPRSKILDRYQLE